MLKRGVVGGGESIVFTTYHDVGVTKIQGHHIENSRQNHPGLRHQRSLSMLNEMPCGKGKDVLYTKGNEASAMKRLVQRLQDGRRCGFAVVDIQIPGDLWTKF